MAGAPIRVTASDSAGDRHTATGHPMCHTPGVEQQTVTIASGDSVVFTQHLDRRGRPFWVPDRLVPLPDDVRHTSVVLPLNIEWSMPGRSWDLTDAKVRATLIETVLREGDPADLARYVDGRDLVEAWEAIVLPIDIRQAWKPLVQRWHAAV